MTRIGLIADTHGLMRAEALAALRGVDHILHAGDVGSVGVLEGLRGIAPVTAVRGNVDRAAWCELLPNTATLQFEGVLVHVVHDIGDYRDERRNEDVVVYGHSHRSRVETRNGVLFVNPGAAGPRRFRLPVSVGLAWVRGSAVETEIVRLPI